MIRARPNPPAVVLITAHGNESLAAAALRLGADDYLAKDQSLLEMLPEILERVRRSRELRKALVAAERDLVRAERLAAIGEMTVALHHGINNPLMSASTDVELLLADPDLPPDQRRQALEDLRTSLRRISDIVRQIGDLRAIHTKTYLPGIQMVDLDAENLGAPAPHRGTALVQVAEEDMARIVVLLLRHAGFAVERCATTEDLRLAAVRVGVTLVLLLGGAGAAGAHPLGGFDPPPRPRLSRGGPRRGRRRGGAERGRGPGHRAALRSGQLHRGYGRSGELSGRATPGRRPRARPACRADTPCPVAGRSAAGSAGGRPARRRRSLPGSRAGPAPDRRCTDAPRRV